jgi:hypothetical protein
MFKVGDKVLIIKPNIPLRVDPGFIVTIARIDDEYKRYRMNSNVRYNSDQFIRLTKLGRLLYEKTTK